MHLSIRQGPIQKRAAIAHVPETQDVRTAGRGSVLALDIGGQPVQSVIGIVNPDKLQQLTTDKGGNPAVAHPLTPIIETPRLRLREYTYEDLDDLAAMFADAELMRYYSHPKSPEESLAWIEWNLGLYEQRGFGLWVMESLETSEFVGDCGLTPQTVDGVTDIEVGWHTRREYWNQGLATEGASACRDYAFGDLGLQRLISIIHPDNRASRRVAEKIGMTLEKTVLHGSGPKVIYAVGRA